MSREIKFRAWVIAKNCYMEVVSIEFSTNKVILKGTWNKANNAPMMKVVPLDKVILEQYTGLKDENGKEIYEGDIVTLCGEWEDVEPDDCSVITFGNGCFRIGNDYENEAGTYLSDWRVIGNIHENPELLGGEE